MSSGRVSVVTVGGVVGVVTVGDLTCTSVTVW